MAQGAAASATPGATIIDKAQALHEIEELAKIVRFRDAVLAGQHPKFKVPAHVAGPRNAPSPKPLQSQPTFATPNSNQNTYSNSEGEISSALHGSRSTDLNRISNGMSSSNGLANGSKSAINPVLLGKSDDLIKAEIQLQRQRLERSLRDQVEKRRLEIKAALQTSDSLPDFDLSEVLFKALSIVHPSTTTEVEPSVGARSASDSFDENTFYSSQHDTPEPDHSSHKEKVAGKVTVQDAISTDSYHIDPFSSRDVNELRDVVMGDAQVSTDVESDVQEVVLENPLNVPSKSQNPVPVTTLNRATQIQALVPAQYGKDFVDITYGESDVDQGSKPQSRQGQVSGYSTPSSQDAANVQTVQSTGEALLENAFPPSPRILSQGLSLLAPQPARVSPLVTNKPPPHQSIAMEEAPVAQVVALRESGAASSPDSSPKGQKAKKDKKKKKKEKRKSNGKGSAVETPDTPYIKPEPRSPSPFVAAPLPRPKKRQRQSMDQTQSQGGLNYDEPNYEFQPEVYERQPRYQQARPPPSYTRPLEPRSYEQHDPRPAAYRELPREEPQYRRVVSHEVHRGPQPPMYAPSYPTYDQRAVRAPSIVVLDRPTEEAPRHHREEVLPPRVVTRSVADRERSRSPIMHDNRSPVAMAPPPRAAPRRIVVDEYGRQFYAPEAAPAPVRIISRQSVAPYSRHGDEEVIYERPIRTVPRAVAETWEEDGVIYRRASPFGGAPPRRVVTQPEYDNDFRSYRQREYSARPPTLAQPPASQAGEYARPAEATTRREMSHFDGPPPPPTYRVGSARPEAQQYEAPREYAGRMQSVRPEPIPREYAAPISRPQSRVAAHNPDSYREYSVRPTAEHEYTPREYIAPSQHEGYAPPPRQVIRRVVGDVEYIERPREDDQQAMYQGGPRQVIYR